MSEDFEPLCCDSCGYVFDESDFEDSVLDMIHQVGVWQCPECGTGNDFG